MASTKPCISSLGCFVVSVFISWLSLCLSKCPSLNLPCLAFLYLAASVASPPGIESMGRELCLAQPLLPSPCRVTAQAHAPRCGLVGHAHILAHQQHVAVLEHVDKPVEWGRVGPGASCHTCGALHGEDYQPLLAPLVEEAAELSPREESSIQQFLFLLLHGCAW